MSDNTPIGGNKNSETDAAPTDPTATAGSATPGHAAPAVTPTAAVAPTPEPLVIDYDSINANLTVAAAERAGEVDANRTLPQHAASLPDPVDRGARDLADEYEDSAPTVVARPPVGVETPTAASVAPSYAPPVQQTPIYVQAPAKPRDRSNRGAGILIALLAALVFAVLYATAAFVIIGVTSSTINATLAGFSTFAALPVFYIPVIVFFLALSGLIAVVNRGGWWAYVLFGFIVAVAVYFSYIGGALLGLVFDGTAANISAGELGRIVGSLWLNPGALAAALIAREVPIWTGAWVARRGRRVTARNLAARTEYERLLAEGPQITRP